MEVIILLVFVSLVLVVGAVLFFVVSVRQGDLEHGDRLTLLPLDPDESTAPEERRETSSGGRNESR